MTWATRLVARLRTAFFGSASNARIDAEFASHIAFEIDALRQQGFSDADARRMAHATFGSPTAIKEGYRDQLVGYGARAILRDFRFAWRVLRRQPTFSLSVVVVSAVGIASTTAMMTIVHYGLLRPLPIAERIFLPQLEGDGGRSVVGTSAAFRVLERAPGIKRAARYSVKGAVFENGEAPERLRAELITATALPLLGWSTRLGRGFNLDDERSGSVAIISHRLWQRRFSGDSSVIGRVVRLDNRSVAIVGVLDDNVTGARPWVPDVDVWLPLDRYGEEGSAFVQLEPNASPALVSTQLSAALNAKTTDLTGADSVAARVVLVSFQELAVGDLTRPLWLMFGAVLVVLLLVGSNVGTMMLARTNARATELHVRGALGASPWQQMRLVLTEGVLLAAISAAVGIIAVVLLMSGVRTLGVGDMVPRLAGIRVKWQALVGSVALTMLFGLAIGLVPSRRALRLGNATSFYGARIAESWGGVRRGMVVIQIALSLVLLVCSGLMVKGFLRVLPSAPGYDVADRYRIFVQADSSSLGSAQTVGAFSAAVVERLRRVPGVSDVAIAEFVPLIMESALSQVQPEGFSAPEGSRPLTAHHRAISNNYFDVVGMRVLSGRGFQAIDIADAPRTVVINETAARRWWPNASPLGRTVRFSEGRNEHAEGTVIGVVNDVRFSGHDTRTRAELYVAVEQRWSRHLNFVVRMQAGATPHIEGFRQAVWSVAPRLPVEQPDSFADIAHQAVSVPRFYAAVLALFGVIAIVIAAASIYSLLTYAVSQRTREIGVRLALGSTRARVLVTVVRQGMTLAAFGLVLGVVTALAVTRLLESLLFEVTPTDPSVFFGTSGALMVLAFFACLAPAMRASRIDPARSLIQQ